MATASSGDDDTSDHIQQQRYHNLFSNAQLKSQNINEKKGATIMEKGKRVPFEPVAEGTTTDPITARMKKGKMFWRSHY